MATLDYSVAGDSSAPQFSAVDVQALVDQASLGTRTDSGLYEVKDWEFAKSALEKKEEGEAQGSLGALGSIFSRLTGSKTLTQTDLKPVLEAMKQHLMKKNVAKEIADKVCEGVGESLVGKKVGGFQSKSTLRCTKALSHLFCFSIVSDECSCSNGALDFPHKDSDTENVDGFTSVNQDKTFLATPIHPTTIALFYHLCWCKWSWQEHQPV